MNSNSNTYYVVGASLISQTLQTHQLWSSQFHIMPRWSPSSGHNRVAISFLAANAVFSVHTMWAALWRNGYFGALMRLWEDGPHMLPGTSNPILTKYTSIRPLDRLITFSVVPFANVTDGSTPQFSLFAFHFSDPWPGYYLCSSLLMVVECRCMV